MAKKNTNFNLGLTRQQLIETAQLYGKSEKSAKKASTKTLEKYLTVQIAGKGTKVPEITERQKQDIKDHISSYGLLQGVALLNYRVIKSAGKVDENNYIRLSLRDKFRSFYNGEVKSEHIDYLVSKMDHLDYYTKASALYDLKNTEVTDILRNYGDELNAKDKKEKEGKQ